MADLSISSANVGSESTRTRSIEVATGETIGVGDAVAYAYESDVEKAFQADATTADGEYDVKGIAITGDSAGGFIVVAEKGPVELGTTMTVGVAYGVSTTAGGIAPDTDFNGYSSATQCQIGVATAAGVIEVDPFVTGATKA